MTNDRIWILLARSLAGEASLTELEELNKLTTQFPQQKKTVEAVAGWWSLNPGADTDFLDATYLAHLERMKQKGFYLNDEPVIMPTDIEELTIKEAPAKGKLLLRRLLVAGLCITSLVATWLFLKPLQNLPKADNTIKVAEVSTRNGTRSKILLPDGTNVWLNSGSKISYSKELDTSLVREVYLTGEAFFDVARSAKRPFIIHTANMNIRVLGTRFNVKAYDEDKTTETSLMKGSIEVYLKNNPARKYLLTPNQKLILQNELPAKAAKSLSTVASSEAPAPSIEIRPLTYLKGTETYIESSWTKNILSFEDESFKEVAKKMERWFDVKFEFKNKNWELQFLNGSFEKESLEQAMTALKFSTGFGYTIEGKKIIIY